MKPAKEKKIIATDPTEGCALPKLEHREMKTLPVEQLTSFLQEAKESGVFETNIFGKSIGELVEDGIRSKIASMDDECQLKLQDTMQKIVNDNNGGLICFII